MKLTKVAGLSIGMVLASAPAYAQQSPLNITASFSTISAYPPPQYIIAGELPGTNGGYIGYGVDLSHKEPVYGNAETEVTGVVLDGSLPTSIACQRLDGVTSQVTVDGKVVNGQGTVTPPDDQTALYACAVYTNPAGAPVPTVPPLGGCQTYQNIWSQVQAQGACYTVGEYCINTNGPRSISVMPDAQGCTHFEVIHAFNITGNPDCCHTGLCVAGSGCLLPPSHATCSRLCNSNGE